MEVDWARAARRPTAGSGPHRDPLVIHRLPGAPAAPGIHVVNPVTWATYARRSAHATHCLSSRHRRICAPGSRWDGRYPRPAVGTRPSGATVSMPGPSRGCSRAAATSSPSAPNPLARMRRTGVHRGLMQAGMTKPLAVLNRWIRGPYGEPPEFADRTPCMAQLHKYKAQLNKYMEAHTRMAGDFTVREAAARLGISPPQRPRPHPAAPPGRKPGRRLLAD